MIVKFKQYLRNKKVKTNKVINLPVRSTVSTPSNTVIELIEKISTVNTDMGGMAFNSKYYDFKNYVLNNADGYNLPLVKQIEENLEEGITKREMQNFKKKMLEEGILQKSGATSYIISPDYRV